MKRITTPFGFRSTAAEVAKGIDLSGKRVIVTDGASGIGVETARALAGIGGRYFSDCQEAEPVLRRQADYGGVASYAVDPDNAERLWEESLRLLAS